MSSEILFDQSTIRRRGTWRRPMAVDTIRRVHAYTEEDGRQALVVRGRGLRLVAIPGESLADPLLRLEVSALLERLQHQGVPIDSGAKQLVEGSRPDDA